VDPDISAHTSCNGERETARHTCNHCLLNEAQAQTLRRDLTQAIEVARYARETAAVALRMLQNAGKLRPRTDDERAVLRALEHQLSIPAGGRRLIHPLCADYVGKAAEGVRLALHEPQDGADAYPATDDVDRFVARARETAAGDSGDAEHDVLLEALDLIEALAGQPNPGPGNATSYVVLALPADVPCQISQLTAPSAQDAERLARQDRGDDGQELATAAVIHGRVETFALGASHPLPPAS